MPDVGKRAARQLRSPKTETRLGPAPPISYQKHPVDAAAKPSFAGKSLIGLAAGCLYHATPAQFDGFGKRADFSISVIPRYSEESSKEPSEYLGVTG